MLSNDNNNNKISRIYNVMLFVSKWIEREKKGGEGRARKRNWKKRAKKR